MTTADASDKEHNQRKVFEFLKQKYRSGDLFTMDELAAETTWQGSTFPTYWSKQFRDFAVEVQGGKFRVSRAFRIFLKWDKFRNHVTQNRRVVTDYEVNSFESVLIFEFFMPLAHEVQLRTLLDELFYRDSLLNLLKSIKDNELKARFEPELNETDDKYFDRACEWLSTRFGGYSISHVNGRFRAGPLRTTGEAAEAFTKGERYLVDETTAIVRFIFPCGESKSRRLTTIDGAASDTVAENTLDLPTAEKQEAELVRWFFEALFIQSMLEAVEGEDEIWVVESGLSNRLHIYRGLH